MTPIGWEDRPDQFDRLDWLDSPTGADVVIGSEEEGRLLSCAVWPGAEGAEALIRAGLAREGDRERMDRLHRVGCALASEQDLDRLLDLILKLVRELLNAEAGSIYLVEGEGEAASLLFAHTQNARVNMPFKRSRMPITTSSMAGFVAETGGYINIHDVYEIPAGAPYRFNDFFDRLSGYRSKSMLAVPLKDSEGNVLGVMQLINRLGEGGMAEPFLPEHRLLADSLAAQAGVAVKNAMLKADIEHLFESFVHAAVTAIEQRDPTTSGHSSRVATLTVALAKAVNEADEGPLAEVGFSRQQLREIRYAALLHDFGKVGVREAVLIKSKKLDENRLELLLQRLQQHREEILLARLKADWEAGVVFNGDMWSALDRELTEEAAQWIDLLKECNEPIPLPGWAANALEEVGGVPFSHWSGKEERLLEPGDVKSLKIPKGNLSDEERAEIEAHVTHTYRFLNKIPWTNDLAGIPEIAYAHHEKLNGKGYPRGVGGDSIPIQSRAMAIADIFDALAAQDRPYKAAMPLEKCLEILRAEADNGGLDGDLVQLFIEKKVYETLFRP